jgi:hypothetical protein
MDDNFITFWARQGGWAPVRAEAFRRGRRAWSFYKLSDDDIGATVDDVGFEIFNRRHVNAVEAPGPYLLSVVAKRLYDTYKQTLDPFERAAGEERRRALGGLARGDEAADRSASTDGGREALARTLDDIRTRLVRYDDERVGEVSDASSEDDLEGVVDLGALVERLRVAAAAVRSWGRTTKGRTVATIAEIAARALELLVLDPDALRAWGDPRGGPRLVVRAAMGDVNPARWGGRSRYEPVSRASVSPVVWQELHGRYCEPALELLRWALGDGATRACA